MSILKIAQLGNPVLRQETSSLSSKDIMTPYVQKLIDDMVETMKEYEGVGLAAPQIHEPKQITVIESAGSVRYPNTMNIPLTVLINPVITWYSEEKADGWEGCLSIEEFRGLVPRSTSVRVSAMDRKGKSVSINATGFFAVVLQHEIDHLNGTVFIDRIKDLKTLSFFSEYERYWVKDVKEK
ncbi:MAG: peptide deformylase [Nitrospinota bacterium]|jgi:peptide deformylase